MLDSVNISRVLDNIQPDLKPVLQAMFSEEDWTHSVAEVDEVVRDLAALLPEVASFPVDAKYIGIVDQLILVLAHLQVDIFFVSLLYLQRGSYDADGEAVGPGWGSFLHARALELSEGEGSLNSEASAVLARLQVIVRQSKLASIFLANANADAYVGKGGS